MTALATARVPTNRRGPAGLPRLLAGDLIAPAGQGAGGSAFATHRARYGPLPLPRSDRAGRAGLIDAVTAAGLRGRGGAGFPTGRKLATVAAGGRQPIVVANGCEGEPASSKDTALLSLSPHLVLDGAALAARAIGADEVLICVHRGNGQAGQLAREIAARAGDPVTFRVIEVPRRYVASEESALVHYLNTGEARPTAVPPRPFEKGVRNRPTLVDNVETLAHLAQIAYFGPNWFRQAGLAGDPGTSLVTVDGSVARPGVYEMALGTTLGDLIALAGGATEPLQAVLVGGYFGTWVPMPEGLSVPLSHDAAGPTGVTLGAGAVIALPATSCGLAETARVIGYLAEESAQQCGPCMFGLPAVARDLRAVAHGQHDGAAYQRLAGRLEIIAGRGACKHPDGAVRLADSALRTFRADLRAHLSHRPCHGLRRRPLLPLPGPGERDTDWI